MDDAFHNYVVQNKIIKPTTYTERQHEIMMIKKRAAKIAKTIRNKGDDFLNNPFVSEKNYKNYYELKESLSQASRSVKAIIYGTFEDPMRGQQDIKYLLDINEIQKNRQRGLELLDHLASMDIKADDRDPPDYKSMSNPYLPELINQIADPWHRITGRSILRVNSTEGKNYYFPDFIIAVLRSSKCSTQIIPTASAIFHYCKKMKKSWPPERL